VSRRDRTNSPDETPAAVRFASVSRHFGEVRAVDEVSFEVRDGEFFSMLGPSGSGKTTCLRLIAGFEQPDSGRVYIHGEDVEGVPPYDRDVNTVFQDYALFPHMTVLDNTAYGLMVRKVEAKERRRRAEEALELVRLSGLGRRKPAELSGGQRQRVALARALINHPRVLLLDEPLGALDLKLRERMQSELKALQRKVGITFVYVTHDQQEALGMSDRLAVFNGGRIEQIGTPREIYEHPARPFVAGFVGSSNLVEPPLSARIAGIDRPFVIRPERLVFLGAEETPGDAVCVAAGTVAEVQYQGPNSRYEVALDGGGRLTAIRPNGLDGIEAGPRVGEKVRLAFERAAMQVMAAADAADAPR
jgi:putative spermidine/putrescine transport system ATP-binding protein